LTGSDPDGDAITYIVVDSPSSGVLTGTAPNLTYTPNGDFNGADSFTFKVNDGTDDSNEATVSITVDPVNDAPTADGQSQSTNEDTPLGITLTGGDIDGDSDIDILLGTLWLQNDGGTFGVHTLFDTGGSPDRNRLADIDGDGRLDSVVGYEAISTEGTVAWYGQPDTATNAWTEHVIASDVVGPMSLDVADIDGDGDLDVVVGEHNLSNPDSARLLVFENTDSAGGSWEEHLVSVGDEHHDGAQLVDIDGDNDLDIVSTGWGHERVLLYENLAL
jgi:hypothetical protein